MRTYILAAALALASMSFANAASVTQHKDSTSSLRTMSDSEMDRVTAGLDGSSTGQGIVTGIIASGDKTNFYNQGTSNAQYHSGLGYPGNIPGDFPAHGTCTAGMC